MRRFLIITAIYAAIFAVPVTAQTITNWDNVQGAIDNAVSGAVIDLSSLSSLTTSTPARTFTVGNSKTITIRGTAGRQLDRVAFTFGSNNNITIENLNVRAVSNQPPNNGSSTLHFTGTGNTLNLVGTNTIRHEYFGAVGVPIGAGLTITSNTNAVLNATAGLAGAGIGGGADGNVGVIFAGSVSLVGGGVGTIIINGGTITANGSSSNGAGIGGSGGNMSNTGGAGGTITINGGTITANGGGSGAGIGGCGGGNGGTITINGGTITANGSGNSNLSGGIGSGAGIGGSRGGNGGSITISGGTITANGGSSTNSAYGNSSGAGIGGGSNGDGGTITISGGTITANGSDRGAGIGGAGSGSGGTIRINGGTVKAKAGAVTSGTPAMDIGNGSGSTGTFTLRNSSGQNVFLNILTVPSQFNTAVTNLNIGGVTNYGIKDVRTDNQGNLHFYLPALSTAQIVSATVGGAEYATPAYIRESNHNNAQTMTGGDISDAVVSVNAIYTGSAITPAVVTVTLNDFTLRQNTDYTITWDGEDLINTSSTDAKVIITGRGAYNGTVEQPFTIEPKPLTTAMLSIPAVTFNNTEHTPVLTVVDGTRTLVEDTDYTVDLEPQTDAGTYAITVTGIGNYTGTPSVNFIINPLALTEADVVVSGTYIFNGAEHVPETEDVVVTLDDYTLTYDFTVTANINAGEATVTVTGTGNFGGTATGTFTIQPKSLIDAIQPIPAVVFNGNPRTPVLTVVDDIKTLVRGTDYTALLTPQTDAGTYEITVSGIGNYTGELSVDFVIEPKTLTEAMLSIPAVTYNGMSRTPVLTVIDGTRTLAVNTDYTVTLTPQTNADTYAITVTGINNYTGTPSVDFVINPKALTTAMLSVPAVVFNGNPQTPNLTAADHDIDVLTIDIDFTTTLTPQTDVGTYPITVTGTGNYTGTQSVNFVINPKPLTAEMLSIPSVVFDSTSQTPVLTVVDGTKTLVRNTDFTVTLTPRTNAGTYPVTVIGMGNYTGTPSVDFVINAREVSVLSPNRVIPDIRQNEETATSASVNALTGEFTAGPNPVLRSSNNVNFFRQGKQVQNATLTIFDASGNFIKKISIKDETFSTQERRNVGSWDLTDSKGRLVSEGTYLLRGVITTSDSKKERVSAVIGVR